MHNLEQARKNRAELLEHLEHYPVWLAQARDEFSAHDGHDWMATLSLESALYYLLDELEREGDRWSESLAGELDELEARELADELERAEVWLEHEKGAIGALATRVAGGLPSAGALETYGHLLVRKGSGEWTLCSDLLVTLERPDEPTDLVLELTRAPLADLLEGGRLTSSTLESLDLEHPLLTEGLDELTDSFGWTLDELLAEDSLSTN